MRDPQKVIADALLRLMASRTMYRLALLSTVEILRPMNSSAGANWFWDNELTGAVRITDLGQAFCGTLDLISTHPGNCKDIDFRIHQYLLGHASQKPSIEATLALGRKYYQVGGGFCCCG